MYRFILGFALVFALQSVNTYARTSGSITVGTDKKPVAMTINVPRSKDRLQIAIGDKKKYDYAGKLRYLSYLNADELDYFEKSGQDGEPTIEDPAFNNVLLSLIGDKMVYYDGHAMNAYTYPALNSAITPSSTISVHWDDTENFEFFFKVTNGGDGYIFLMKDGALYGSKKIKELEYAYYADPKFKRGALVAEDGVNIPLTKLKTGKSAVKEKAAPEEEEVAKEDATEDSAAVEKAIEILNEQKVDVEGDEVELGKFIEKNFELYRRPLARRAEFDSLKKEIQLAMAGLTMAQGGGVRVTGRPGTGKSYFLETLVSYLLQNTKEPTVFLRFAASTLIAGDGVVGPTERKISALKAAAQHVKVVLLIDEIHSLVGAGRYKGNDVDFFQHIKTELASGQIKIVGTTTDNEWQVAFSGDQALSERFPINIKIDEPTDARVLEILADFTAKESGTRQVSVAAPVLQKILQVSKQFDPIGANPRKSIRLLDFALSMAAAQGVKALDENHVIDYASQLYGYDIRELETEAIRKRIGSLVAYLDTVLIGMKDAKARVTRSIGAHYFTQFNQAISSRPFGALLYGKRGVGKTAMATHVAKGLGFGFTKIMMAEYATPMDVETFKARLAMSIRSNPYSVILLDEIEKADESVQRALLQVMDEGRFHAKLGETYGAQGAAGAEVDASKTLFIMTTNAGQDMAGQNASAVRFQDAAEADGLNSYLLDRIGEFIPLTNPTREEVIDIVAHKWTQYKQGLAERKLTVGGDDAAIVNAIVSGVLGAENERQNAHAIGMIPFQQDGKDIVLSVRELERRVADVSQDVANHFLLNPQDTEVTVEVKDGKVVVAPPTCDARLTKK